MTNRVETDGQPAGAAPVFLVLESDALIAADIADALSSKGPCRVVTVTKPAEIPAQLEGVTHVSAALLEMRYADFMASGLPDLLDPRCGQIILTAGDMDQDKIAERGWILLIRPFTDVMIHRALNRARPRF